MGKGRHPKKHSVSSENLSEAFKTIERNEQECIIAHVPYPEDSDDGGGINHNDSRASLIEELESGREIDRSRIIRFLKDHSKNNHQQVKREAFPEISVKTSSLPIEHVGDLVVSDTTCCWWCTYPVRDGHHPFHLPHWTVDGVFYVTGYFCSYNCALSYNTSLQDNHSNQRASLLWILYNRFLSNGSMPPAPPRELLTRFGGWMSIDEFREHSCTLNHDVRLLIPPLQSIYYTIESQKRPALSSSYPLTNSYVPLDHRSVNKARETLKLKRSVPKKSNYVSLEETMGIIKRPREETSH